MTRRCQFCHGVLYGRSDKRYCSPTCRRDACRARTRVIRLRSETVIASEWSHPVERALIPWLEREYGPNHRVVHQARREAENLRQEKFDELARALARVELGESIRESEPD